MNDVLSSPEVYNAISPYAWFVLAIVFGAGLTWIGVQILLRVIKMLEQNNARIASLETDRRLHEHRLNEHGERIGSLEDWRNDSNIVKTIPARR